MFLFKPSSQYHGIVVAAVHRAYVHYMIIYNLRPVPIAGFALKAEAGVP